MKETIFENVNMALLAEKDLKPFINEQFKHGRIPFYVIKNEKRVTPYVKKIVQELNGKSDNNPHVIVLVLNYNGEKFTC